MKRVLISGTEGSSAGPSYSYTFPSILSVSLADLLQQLEKEVEAMLKTLPAADQTTPPDSAPADHYIPHAPVFVTRMVVAALRAAITQDGRTTTLGRLPFSEYKAEHWTPLCQHAPELTLVIQCALLEW